MTRSCYILGGAGTGKSTFTRQLLEDLGYEMGPLEDLHAQRNAKALVTLRGHYVGPDGLYLGCMRDSFPGTDGLDRASSPVGREWLEQGGASRLGWLIAEGATLATRPFLTALRDHTDLLVVHLHCLEETKLIRFAARGSGQDMGWVKNTVTRASNLFTALGGLSVDTADGDAWDIAQDLCCQHLVWETSPPLSLAG